MSRTHSTFWQHYPDEAHRLCFDCDYKVAYKKTIDGAIEHPGKVINKGDEVAHGNGGDTELVVV